MNFLALTLIDFESAADFQSKQILIERRHHTVVKRHCPSSISKSVGSRDQLQSSKIYSLKMPMINAIQIPLQQIKHHRQQYFSALRVKQ